MSSLRSAAYLLVIALFVGVGPAQERPKPADAAKKDPAGPAKKPTVMQRKLAHAQKVLEGLAKEDYEAVRGGADGLLECIRDSAWRINDGNKYMMYSDDFRRTVEAVQKAGKDKKIDAAALAYVDMTLSCVKCHRYLRDVGLARGPEAFPPLAGGAAVVRRE